jgi:hypothetical protein
MKGSPIIRVSLPVELRIANLVEDYGNFEKKELETCINKITKKLGGSNTALAIGMLYNNDLDGVTRIMLNYYDKSYQSLLERNKKNIIHTLVFSDSNPGMIAEKVISVLKKTPIDA